uniref:Cobalt-precorrin-5B (C1)-methyltransferase n=1 Tax=Candidatus Kentrum sp. FM TaxID=2126340 RepID=A0A450VUI7_9GAMM|nr:MAG: cobalt-precorrin-5B (C1)-methyltransferase [Candidatus Kentron sp. FM]VFJ70027.1 MAG: cobalt-precorrin-5B (C1)-methyltransferase [Candidatus Kentron sp. FM]VFK08437.1 MAG: cobalt-precorrin-5B (C1)-methyltransferase [Candidatus Kentron sp. FM]
MAKKTKSARTGFTTGACATAAARAATQALVSAQVPESVECLLPNGQRVYFPVTDTHQGEGRTHAGVIKDAGDDPDCTHGAHLTADARLLPDLPGKVRIEGGDGVGMVSLPGLGLQVGGPAINSVPRRSIEDNVRLTAGLFLDQQGVQITISVPGGQVMTRKTFNPRLGILGGISTLGTTGIVRPWSTVAFRATVVQGIEVAAAQGQESYSPPVGAPKGSPWGGCPILPPCVLYKWGIFCVRLPHRK